MIDIDIRKALHKVVSHCKIEISPNLILFKLRSGNIISVKMGRKKPIIIFDYIQFDLMTGKEIDLPVSKEYYLDLLKSLGLKINGDLYLTNYPVEDGSATQTYSTGLIEL